MRVLYNGRVWEIGLVEIVEEKREIKTLFSKDYEKTGRCHLFFSTVAGPSTSGFSWGTVNKPTADAMLLELLETGKINLDEYH